MELLLQEMTIVRIVKTPVHEITHGNVTFVKYRLQKGD